MTDRYDRKVLVGPIWMAFMDLRQMWLRNVAKMMFWYLLKIKDILSVVEKVGRRLIRNDVFIFHLCLEFTNFI